MPFNKAILLHNIPSPSRLNTLMRTPIHDEYDQNYKTKDIKPEMIRWLNTFPFTNFVTLAFNRYETIDSARENLKKVSCSTRS